MKRRPLVVTISVGLMAGLAFTPTTALAGRPHGGPGGGGGRVASSTRALGSHHHGSRHHHHHGFHHHHHGFRPFFPWGVVTIYVPPVYWGVPAYYPRYYPPLAYYVPNYAPPAVYSSVAPSLPRVIQYPHGRYELRGDGVTTPYSWVWIPNPPPPPPPAAPPAGPLGSDDPLSPSRHIELYRSWRAMLD